MRNLKRVLVALFVLVLAALVLFFVLENQQAVGLVMFGWTAPVVPVAVPVIAALLIGLAIGPFLATYTVLRARRRLRRQAV